MRYRCVALITHCPPYRRRKCSDQYCACAAPAAMPVQKGTVRQCSIVVTAPKSASGGYLCVPDVVIVAFQHGVTLERHSTISQLHPLLKQYHKWENLQKKWEAAVTNPMASDPYSLMDAHIIRRKVSAPSS